MTISITTDTGKRIEFTALGFSGGERHVQLNDFPIKKPKVFNVSAMIKSSDDVMDLLLINNALENHYKETVLLNLEIPYLPYARQDRVCAEGQAFSLQLMAQILKLMNVAELVTWDCHSQVGIDLTGATNISSIDIIQASQELTAILQHQDSVLVCPDKGALTRCHDLQQALDINDMVICEKKRNPASGKITHTEVLIDDLTGKTAVITDDICDGGYTFIKIAEQLKAKNVDKVILYVTHGIFSKGLQVFDGLVDQIFISNSFLHDENEKLTVIDYKFKFTKT